MQFTTALSVSFDSIPFHSSIVLAIIKLMRDQLNYLYFPYAVIIRAGAVDIHPFESCDRLSQDKTRGRVSKFDGSY